MYSADKDALLFDNVEIKWFKESRGVLVDRRGFISSIHKGRDLWVRIKYILYLKHVLCAIDAVQAAETQTLVCSIEFTTSKALFCA